MIYVYLYQNRDPFVISGLLATSPTLSDRCDKLAKDAGLRGALWGVNSPHAIDVKKHDIRCIRAARMVGTLLNGIDYLSNRPDLGKSRSTVYNVGDELMTFCLAYLDLAVTYPDGWFLVLAHARIV